MSKVLPVGSNHTRLWELTPRERLARIAKAQGLSFASGPREGPLMANLAYVFDPAWLRFVAKRPDHVVTLDGVPVVAHCRDFETRMWIVLAMKEGRELEHGGALTVIRWEGTEGLVNDELRKRERPFMGLLTPETVPALERASYFSAYKGVTDILTKYLWPEWALALTRLAARRGVTANQVTLIGALFCVAATLLFHQSWYWTGLLVGLGFMVLDTVDGKLARCTITSSWWGNVFDHGIDLIHPPFWWWAWGTGLAGYGRILAPEVLLVLLTVIVGGYLAQRVIEGWFIALFDIHIHVWRRFDSWFRLIAARRNPNMIILLGSLIAGRPDWGLFAIAGWTLASVAVHFVQLAQALIARAQGRPVKSWLASGDGHERNDHSLRLSRHSHHRI